MAEIPPVPDSYKIVGGGLTPVELAGAASQGISVLPVYQGLVGTRGEICVQLLASGTAVWGLSRSMHFARGDIQAGSMRVLWGNYYVTSGNVETSPGSATFKAAVEYPVGTITPLTFNGGSATATVAGLADAITDAGGPFIPDGAQFFIRMLYQNAGGVICSGINTNYFLYDDLQYGTGAAVDNVYSGTITSTVGAHSFGLQPLAIIAQTTRTSTVIVGDSRATGVIDRTTDLSGDTGEIARSIGPYMGYTKLSRASSTALQAATNFTNRLRVLAYCSDVIDEYGINDLAVPTAAATVAGYRASLATLFAGKRVWGATLPSVTSSTDSWATIANQTVTNSALAFNALVRTGIAGEYSYFDIARAIDPSDLAKWPVSRLLGATTGTASYATTDGTHETSAANEIIRDSRQLDATRMLRR